MSGREDPLPTRMPKRTSAYRRFADRAGSGLVRAGGLLIIASILGILVFILAETWPLLSGARVSLGRVVPAPSRDIGALVVDDYRTHVITADRTGSISVIRLGDGVVIDQTPADALPPIVEIDVPGPGEGFTGATEDGRVFQIPVDFLLSFDEQTRQVTPLVGDAVMIEMAPEGGPVSPYAIRTGDDAVTTAAGQLPDGRLIVYRREVEENDFTGEIDEVVARHEAATPGKLTHLKIDRDGRNLFGATAGGALVWWALSGGRPGAPAVYRTGGAEITAMALLIGDRSLIVGRGDGSLEVWFLSRGEGEHLALRPIRTMPGNRSAIAAIAPSPRDKGFATIDTDGHVALFHSTARRALYDAAAPVEYPRAMYFTGKADGIVLAGTSRVAELVVDNPHPEVSLRAFLGKVWYEGYPRPEFVWQSSSATDDFEPKLSLTPLLVGSLKGTLYSLLLAIPLGVLGAMYTSQFMHPSLKRIVKPTVEIMAALPSVVLGFLAGLWLAPRVEQGFAALILMAVALPVAALMSGFLFSRLPATVRSRVPMGSEAILAIVFLIAAGWLCIALAGPFEQSVFGGPFKIWLSEFLGVTYDQRNAVVVGLAMGFAVIPIIFSVAEDAFSNVPRNLVAGSLALGANRWQTVTRIVLPTASPGIFSAIMIGFGRAVGETMIVLMATGNTPIMDWSPFNGFRTLSANIAVEIPEAPHGGTLYRTLFLAALLLFILTFVVNTVAEVVRQHLRKRYADL